jgi:hypothetical protein
VAATLVTVSCTESGKGARHARSDWPAVVQAPQPICRYVKS